MNTNTTTAVDYKALTCEAVREILGRDVNALSAAYAGKTINLRVVSATHGWYDQTNDLLKDIYNLNAYKAEVIESSEWQEAFKAAGQKEAMGQSAHDELNALLNQARVSYNVINNDGMKAQFSAGEILKCTLDIVESKAGRRSIAVVSAVAPQVVSIKKRSFQLPA